MKRFMAALFVVAALAGWLPLRPAFASDLDDGISKFTDDSVSADDELGKPSKNIKFIIEKSKSQAKVAQRNSGQSNTTTGSTTGDNNRNSVVMGAGSNVRGDIIIIDQSGNSSSGSGSNNN